MRQNKTALVLGATGGIGGEVAAELYREGWQIVALTRRTAGLNPNYQWMQGDCMNPSDVENAAAGVGLIVHAVNPPGYKNWGQLVLPMLENTIRAAKKNQAQILFPGTLYNYGKGTSQPIRESTPQCPTSRKGKLRVQMEKKLEEAAQEGVSVLIVRAGDYFGPRSGSSWFSQGLVTPGKAVKSITYPGREGAGHAWAYLPDVAKTMVQLLQHPLQNFEVFNFAGHFDSDGTQMIQAVKAATGQPDLRVRRLPWTVLTVLSPFVAFFGEMVEIRYLWMNSFSLDNSKLLEKLGVEPRTPLLEAVQATLEGNRNS